MTKINYDGSITLCLKPKSQEVKRIVRLIQWFGWVCEKPYDMKDHLFALFNCFINIEKRKARLLKKEFDCPACFSEEIVKLVPKVKGMDIEYHCPRCKYRFIKHLERFY
jgi:predicted RNA-binding Zn-ribbon protein involved in translation (DUF1610 family)